MRIIIYGAGGIGSVVGGSLARSGNDVILIARQGHVNAINKNGLKLLTPAGNFVLKIPAIEQPGQIKFTKDDVVFLTMKSQNTEDALKELKKLTDNVPIFCFQNGVRNEEIAAKYFPKVYGAAIKVGAVFLKDGEVTARRNPAGWLVMGHYPTGTDTLLESVAAQLRASNILVMLTQDVMPYKWGKLMNNLNNAPAAITNAKREEIQFIHRAARKELIDLLSEAGIRYVDEAQLAKEWPEYVTNEQRANSVPEVQGSTWQSLSRQQGTVEVEYLNGEVVRLARTLGKKAPINEGLMLITQDMAVKREMPGKYTPEQLGKMLGLL